MLMLSLLSRRSGMKVGGGGGRGRLVACEGEGLDVLLLEEV